MIEMLKSVSSKTTFKLTPIDDDMVNLNWLKDCEIIYNKPCSIDDISTFRPLNAICKEAKRVIKRKLRRTK
jgi:hypothetical protein